MSFSESMASLRQVNLNELDLNNVGSWPAPVRVIACILVVVLVLVGGYYFHLSDLQDNYERVVAEEARSEEHTSELQSRENLVCRLLLEKKNDVYGTQSLVHSSS